MVGFPRADSGLGGGGVLRNVGKASNGNDKSGERGLSYIFNVLVCSELLISIYFSCILIKILKKNCLKNIWKGLLTEKLLLSSYLSILPEYI